MEACIVKEFDIILKIIENDIKYKFEHLKEQVEVVNDILPNSVEIDIKNRIVLATYFEPCTEEEKEEMISYIAEIINQIRIDDNSMCILMYSQMEAGLDLLIRNIHKKEEFRTYINKNKKQKSKFKNMIDFLIKNKILILSDSQVNLVKFIDSYFRKQRNSAAHDLYKVITRKDVIKDIVGDGKNVDLKLIARCNECIDNINALFRVTQVFFEILKKVSDIKGA